MKTAKELIHFYLECNIEYNDIILETYYIEDNNIIIKYSYNDVHLNKRIITYVDVHILDYITFLFNLKK